MEHDIVPTLASIRSHEVERTLNFEGGVSLPALNDARSIRSQAALRQALLTLMDENPFEQITLRDIAAKAGVSYPTFYRHYASKDELVIDIARSEITNLMMLPFRGPEGAPVGSGGERVCAYVQSRRALWQTLMTAGAMPIMREECIRLGQELAVQRPRLNPRFPAEVMSGVVASGLFEIVAWWLRQPKDYPVSEIAQMLDVLVINPVIKPPQAAEGKK